jgi:acyl dehydratase
MPSWRTSGCLSRCGRGRGGREDGWPRLGRVKYLEDFTPGEEFTSHRRYALTEREVREVGERWDPQPFHTDPVAAERSLFGGLVASSVHLFAICVSMRAAAGEDDPVAAVSALGFDELRLHTPARPGDELHGRTRVLACRESKSRPELGIVRTGLELTNQHGDVVFSCESAFLVRRRP